MAREEIVERLGKLDTCAVSDALDSLNLKGATWGVRPMWSCPRIVGRAVTMKIKPAGLEQPKQHLGTAPIEAANGGDIIVIDNGGKLEFSCWGGLLALSAKLKGLSGVVIDGATRDSAATTRLDFPVFSKGTWAQDTKKRGIVTSRNCPVVIDGVTIRKDDLVFGDRDGVVVIPRRLEETVIARALEALEQETRITLDVARGVHARELVTRYGFF